MHYCRHVVKRGIVTVLDKLSSVDKLCSSAALVAHRCKTESYLQPSRWRWSPRCGHGPMVKESLI